LKYKIIVTLFTKLHSCIDNMDLFSILICWLLFATIVWQIIKYIIKLEIERYCGNGQCICNEDIYIENEPYDNN
jgi:hypothetical protein